MPLSLGGKLTLTIYLINVVLKIQTNAGGKKHPNFNVSSPFSA